MTKGHKETSPMFTTLIEVVAPWYIQYVKTSQIAPLKYVQLMRSQVEIKLSKENCEGPNNMWVKLNSWTISVDPLIGNTQSIFTWISVSTVHFVRTMAARETGAEKNLLTAGL